MDKTVDELLEEFGDEPYTREQFEKDRARVVAAIAAKHGVAESDVDALVRHHCYMHAHDAPEDEYVEIMAIAHATGWSIS